MLEPCAGKPACTVLRGEGGLEPSDLLDSIAGRKANTQAKRIARYGR